eukprot:TRINITY_DN9457_c0_g1_i1.p1 TRINITY_DN9457_c0_g1~~TRINITY_DN9457_c0_g1_i1.p1  ORF type:complete len:994 (+),score=200.69 TRINITY_DN9457_c0_g1_i1:77-3058(+)
MPSLPPFLAAAGALEAAEEEWDHAGHRLDVLRAVERDTQGRVEQLRRQLAEAERDLQAAGCACAQQAESVARARCVADEALSLAAIADSDAARAVRWCVAARRKRRAAALGSVAEAERIADPCTMQIGKDAMRTFPAIEGMPGSRDNASERLVAVLRAWCQRAARHGLAAGYVQGMNFRAAMPVLVLGDEDAFALACLLIEEAAPPGTWAAAPPLVGMQASRAVIEEEVRRRLPRLAAALGEQLSLFLALLAPCWLIPLFVGALPWRVAIAAIDDIVEAASNELGGAAVPGGSPTDATDSQRAAAAALAVHLWWFVGILERLEGGLLAALHRDHGSEAQSCMGEQKATAAFHAIRELTQRLPNGFRPRASSGWEPRALWQRHGEALERLTAEFEATRLRPRTRLQQEELDALRQEFDLLRRPMRLARQEVSVPTAAFRDGMVVFEAGGQVVLAVHRDAVPAGGELTGWRLRAVDDCVVTAGADLGSTAWRDWPLARWYYRVRQDPERSPRARALPSTRRILRRASAPSCSPPATPTAAADWLPFDTGEAWRLEDARERGSSCDTRRLSLAASHPSLYSFNLGQMTMTCHSSGQQYELARMVVTPEELAAERPTVDSHLLVLEAGGEMVVYEHEHLSGRHGWQSRGLPKQLQQCGPAEREQLQPPSGCTWEGSWRLDRSVGGDPGGWLYAENYSGPFRPTAAAAADRYRRRRWLRHYRPGALPAAALDRAAPGQKEVGIGLEELAEVTARVAPSYPAECLAGLFRLLDVRREGRVDFYHLIVGLAMLGPGSAEEKLRLLFDLYDVDGKGTLTKEDLVVLVNALHEVAHTPAAVLCAEGGGTELYSAPGGPRVRLITERCPVTVLSRDPRWARVQLREKGSVCVGWVAAASVEVPPSPVAPASGGQQAEGVAARLLALSGSRRRLSADAWVQGAAQQPVFWRAVSAAGIDVDYAAPPSKSPGIFSLHSAMPGAPQRSPPISPDDSAAGSNGLVAG